MSEGLSPRRQARNGSSPSAHPDASEPRFTSRRARRLAEDLVEQHADRLAERVSSNRNVARSAPAPTAESAGLSAAAKGAGGPDVDELRNLAALKPGPSPFASAASTREGAGGPETLTRRELHRSRARRGKRRGTGAAATVAAGRRRTGVDPTVALLMRTSDRDRRRMRSALSGAAMAFVAAVTLATSVPAEALMSSQEVQLRQLATLMGASPTETQTISLNLVAEQQVATDAYVSQSSAGYASSGGASTPRYADTFTNDATAAIQWPFPYGVPLSDRFGYRNCRGCTTNHRGQDFLPGYGTNIQAIADGVVSFVANDSGGLGTQVMIDHLVNGRVVTSVYAHMVPGSVRVNVGDHIKVGSYVGRTGDSGMSTGPHLHFEIRIGGKDGINVDPLVWLRTYAGRH